MATRIGLAKQDGGSKVGADTIRYSAAISACGQSHDWQLALDWLSRLAEAKVDAETICYSAAISACEMRHAWQPTLGLLRRMAEANVEANISSYMVTI